MDIIAERGERYGSPAVNMDRTARLWSAYLGYRVSAHDVAVCMALVKVSRMKATHHDDNYEDAQAYLEIAAIVDDR